MKTVAKPSPRSPHRVALIPELPPVPRRLGRHIQFDERSRAFRAVPRRSGPTSLATTTWKRTVAPFQQGDLGACTGNGAAGLLATAPFAIPRRRVTEKTARSIYSRATSLDAIQGAWPPVDTGSSVLAAMKALVALGYAKGYAWCFGLQDALRTLSTIGPIEVGVNWYEGFDEPDSTGLVRVSGRVRGGHAFEVLGLNTIDKTVTAVNSWGSGWGARGRFVFSWDDFGRLLAEDGEAATLTV